MKRIIGLAGMILAAATMSQASTLQDNINGGATPPFVFYGGPTNIGWYYSANSTYNLDGISTYFEPVPNGTGDHTITVQIWTDRPSAGGTLLGQDTFAANSGSGGNVGGTFAPVLITAGQSYFVDFLNSAGMGVNLGQWANDNQGNPQPSAGATTNLNAWYSDSDGTFPDSGLVAGGAYYTTATGNVSFAEPILYFEGNAIEVSSAPEPSTFALILGGAGVAAVLRKRRSAW